MQGGCIRKERNEIVIINKILFLLKNVFIFLCVCIKFIVTFTIKYSTFLNELSNLLNFLLIF